MRIEDRHIIKAFNDLVAQGHPDPIGFIARAEIISELDDSKKSNGFIGPFAINIKKARQLEVTEAELKDMSVNIETGYNIDGISFEQAKGDLKEMYRISFAKGNSAFEKFYSRLEARKKKLNDQYTFSDGGTLSSLNSDKPDLPGVVVTSKKIEDLPKPEDFSNRPPFKVPLDQIEIRLRALITTIIREQSI